MSRKDELYLLVKSLDKQEKRFFKLHSKLYNQNKLPNYVYLFDIIDKMESFSKEEMIKQLSKQLPKVKVNQLKQYLKYSIYDAIKAYHKKSAFTLHEIEDINIARVLKAKRLNSMAEKILLKLRKTAIAKEDFNLHIQVNAELINTKIGKENVRSLNKVQEYLDESLKSAEKLKQKLLLISIASKTYGKIQSKANIEGKLDDYLNQVINNDLVQFQSVELLSIDAIYLYHNTLSWTSSL